MDKNELKEVLLDIEKEKRNLQQQQMPAESEIDWKALATKAWLGRKKIFSITVVFMVLGLISALTMTRQYTCTVTMMPELGKSGSSSSLSSITSMLGLGGMGSSGSSADAYNIMVYPDVVASTPFTTQLFDIKVKDEENEIDTTLIGYLTREKFSVTGLIVKPVLSVFSKDEEEKEKTDVDVFRLTKKQSLVAEFLKKAISVDVDKKTGQATINVTMDNAVVAATVADTISKRLKDYITDYRTKKAREDLMSYQKMADESYQAYVKASKAYAYYQDHNRGLILHSVISEGTKLNNELQIATQVYQQMKAQAEMARSKVVEEKPVFAIIQPASIPLKPNNSRAKVLIIWTFIGFAIATAWVLYGKEYLGKGLEIFNDVKKGGAKE